VQHHRGDQRSRCCGVDHIIDLEIRCGVERGSSFVRVRDHCIESCLARVGVLDGGQLLAVGELHRSFEAHPAEFAGGPGDGHQRRAEAPTRHRLRAEAVSLAQHDCHEGNRERRSGEEEPARVADERRCLGIGPDHDSRRVAEEEHWQPERLAQLQETRGLVSAVARDRPREVHRIVGHDTDGMALDSRQDGDHAASEAGSHLERRSGVGDDLDGAMHVVCPPPILRHDVAQRILVRRSPRGDRSLEERQRMAGEPNGIGLIGCGDVDDAVLHLHVERSDRIGVDDAESASLDHRRAAHADARIRRRDDQIGAPEQRGVAGETESRCDADTRHEPGEARPERERHDIEPGDHRLIRVTGSAPAALGEEHDRQAASLDDIEETVLLAVPHHALGACEDRVVVGEHGALRSVSTNQRCVHPCDAGDEPVGRGSLHEVIHTAAAALRGDRKTPVLDETPRITQIGDVLARGPAACRVAGGDDIGAALVLCQAPASTRFSEVRTHVLPLGHPMSLGAPVSCRACPVPMGRSAKRSPSSQPTT